MTSDVRQPQLMRVSSPLMILFIALCFVQTAVAFHDPDELAQHTLALKDNFQAVSDAEFAQSAANLRQKLARLEEYLANGDVEGWKEYLDWEVLQGPLADGAEPNVEQLTTILTRFNANHPGLERPEFREAAAALQISLGLLETQSLPDAAERHASLMQTMSEALAGYGTEPTSEHTRIIAQGLGWLAQTHQANDLVDAIRNRYSHPNLLIESRNGPSPASSSQRGSVCSNSSTDGSWSSGQKRSATGHFVLQKQGAPTSARPNEEREPSLCCWSTETGSLSLWIVPVLPQRR